MQHVSSASSLPGAREHTPPSLLAQERLCKFRPYLRQSGNEFRPRWHIPSRSLLDYLLVGVASGEGKFSLGGERFPVGEGDFFWIPPLTRHELRGTSPEMHCLYVHFDLHYDPRRSHWDACIPGGAEDLREWADLADPEADDPVVSSWRGKLKVSHPQRIFNLLEKICLEHCRFGDGQALLLSGMIIQLLSELLYGQEGVPDDDKLPAATHRRKIEEAAAYLREHAGENLSFAAVGARFQLSTSYFRKLFRERYGQSPQAFHNHARMHRACELLIYSGLNVSQVADELGFSCVHAFSRAFRNFFACSPREYISGIQSST